jgi:hypothetical protein
VNPQTTAEFFHAAGKKSVMSLQWQQIGAKTLSFVASWDAWRSAWKFTLLRLVAKAACLAHAGMTFGIF